MYEEKAIKMAGIGNARQEMGNQKWYLKGKKWKSNQEYSVTTGGGAPMMGRWYTTRAGGDLKAELPARSRG